MPESYWAHGWPKKQHDLVNYFPVNMIGSTALGFILMNNRLLARQFYLNEDVVELSKALLGKFIVTEFDGNKTAGMIIETEAYKGVEDKASHAYNNRRTKRTETMYQKGGVAYVYLCYGIHHLFNIVTAG